MATIKETRAASAKRKAEQEEADRKAAAEIAAIRARGQKPEAEAEDERSFLDKLRDLLNPEARAGSDAIAAIESGVDEANAAADDEDKRKKK